MALPTSEGEARPVEARLAGHDLRHASGMAQVKAAAPRGLALVRVLAVCAPLVGVAAVISGIGQARSGDTIGYLLVALGALMFLLTYYFIRITRIARR